MALSRNFDPQGFNVSNALLIGGRDAGNSSTTALGIGATFTGTWKELSPFAELLLEALSPQASAANGLQVQWSHDAGATEDATLRDSFSLAAATQLRAVFVRKARHYRVVLTNGAVLQASLALTADLFAVPALGAGGGAIGGATPPANPPTGPGVQNTLAADASVTIATVQIGRWYMLTVVGGDPVALSFSGVAADRTTMSAWYAGTKYIFRAIATTVRAQKFVAGTVSPTLCTEPLDYGTIA